MRFKHQSISNPIELAEYVDNIGFLPLLFLGIEGWSAQEAVDKDYQYTQLEDGGWEWPLWKWKGDVIKLSGCAYGKFILEKAGFISKDLWPHFCNWRRHVYPAFPENSVEDIILSTLKEHGSLITRDLRKKCGFTEVKSKGKFDTFLTRLERGCYIVTEDFIYPHDKHGKEYGWGWSLLTTPEQLFGLENCKAQCTPEESREILVKALQKIFPDADELYKMILK